MDINGIIRLPDPPKNVKIEVKEVLHDVHGKPQIFIRVRLSGWYFPQRALEPFLVVGNAVSRFVIIEDEGITADAYFDVRLPAARRVSFGYGKTISWDFNVSVNPTKIGRLEQARLPEGVVELKKE